MPVGPIKSRLLIEEFLPNHDLSAGYRTCINAPPSQVYPHILGLDLSEPWIVRLLMTLRTGKPMRRNRAPSDLRQQLQGTGFVVLGEVPGEELVIGVAGRFWLPDGGRCLDFTADDFVGFSRPGFAKVAWNFELSPDSPGTTILSTDTRIKCFGKTALWKFRLYWSLVGPFSGLIRKAILKRVKMLAESDAKV